MKNNLDLYQPSESFIFAVLFALLLLFSLFDKSMVIFHAL